MPSPEKNTPPEHEPGFYSQIARFPGGRIAGRAYGKLQAMIYARQDCDLSTFRIQLNRVYHVAVLGTTPPPDLDRKIQRALSPGELTTLPPEVLEALLVRRLAAIQQGPWTERHHRPERGGQDQQP